jgi:asparagine synthase (glutamine-hydrolysing)
MSALAGIFNFDGRQQVQSPELLDLAHGINRIGTDGGGNHFAGNVAMAYRGFHTTPEAHLEHQPLAREECVLTWDGRLDNREEILERLPREHRDAATDLDMVLAAYKEWGAASFSDLIGDWSIALWDARERKLILARDCFGVRPLFYRLSEGQITWCSILEPLVSCSKVPLTIDHEYIAGCICSYPQLGTTPFREIKAVIPAHFLEVQEGGKVKTERYWCLNPTTRIHYRSDTDYEEHFRVLFRNSVRRRLRSDRPVLCELSGGLDSSSIVCMTEEIRKDDTGPEISTISYFDSDEPGGDERPFIAIIEEMRGKSGSHISMSEFNRRTQRDAIQPLPPLYSCARPGYFQKFLHWDETIAGIQEKANARVILSGLGGDEFLGGVQYEALGLMEYLLAGRFVCFINSMFQWSLARNKPLLELTREVWKLACARKALDAFASPSMPPTWLRRRPIRPDQVLRSFSSWRNFAPGHLCAESTRYGLASMLSCIDPPLVGIAEKRYPYLDRTLFSYLAAIPREQVIRPRERRSLMRRSLRGLVPDFVLFRKTKWFGRRSATTFLRDQESSLNQMFSEPWKSDGHLFDVSLIRERLRGLQHGAIAEGLQLTSAVGVEQWIRQLLVRGTIGPLMESGDRSQGFADNPPTVRST